MKLLSYAIAAVLLGAAAPALAHEGHPYWKHERWSHFDHFHRWHRPHYHGWMPPGRVKRVEYYVVTPPPQPGPAPGIHVIFPDIYVPWPR